MRVRRGGWGTGGLRPGRLISAKGLGIDFAESRDPAEVWKEGSFTFVIF